MRLLAALGGTDAGRSGLGTYVREMLPRVARRCAGDGGDIVVCGTELDHAAYPELDGLAARVVLSRALDAPALSAAWHAVAIGSLAASLGADALLMPAANRRVPLRSSVRTIAVVHDLAMLRVRKKYDALRTAYARSLVVGGLRRAETLVSISQATTEDVVRFTGRSARDVVVVPHGVDAGRFSPAAEGAARPWPRPYVLYPARLEHPGKNHVGLLQAFARATLAERHDLVLCGDDWGGRALVMRVAAELRLTDRVHVLGRVDDPTLRALTQHASAVAMVGLHEGFGLPALEALACGVPVVAADAGALPEVVGDVGELADPYDAGSMAAALERAVSPSGRARARALGPAWARRWDWQVAAARLYDACHPRFALSKGDDACRRPLPRALAATSSSRERPFVTSSAGAPPS